MERIPPALLDGAEARLLRWMVLFAVLGAVALLVARGPQMAGGFAAGAALSVLGFRWLERGMAAALDASRTRVPRSVGIKLMLRYPAMIGAVLVVYETHWLPVVGVLMGLFVPIAGAIAESFVLMGRVIVELRG
jgi:hypothetical protein